MSHSLAESNESYDEILTYLSKLFDGLNLDSGINSASVNDGPMNEPPENTLTSLPKCKAYDVPLELASAAYFIVDRYIYAWNNMDWSIFAVNDACEPSEPFYVPGPNQDIVIMDAVFRIDEHGTVFRWFSLDQWIEEPLHHVFGDARALLQEFIRTYHSFPLSFEEPAFLPTYAAGVEFSYASDKPLDVHTAVPEDPITALYQSTVNQLDKRKSAKDSESSGTALLNSLLGFGPNVIASPSPLVDETFPLTDANGVDLSTSFLGEGTSLSFDSISQWVESQKSMGRTPGSTWLCPLNGCGRVLRRPHALKDHLLFHFDIKAFKCSYSGCTSSFSTKCNCDRHEKSCKYAP